MPIFSHHSGSKGVDFSRRALYISALMMDTCGGICLFALPLFLVKELGASVFTVGLTGTLAALGYTLFCLCSGRLSDRLGRKKVAGIGILIVICAYLLVSQMKAVFPIFGLVIVGALGFSLFWPPVQAWLAESTSREHLVATIGLFNIAWSSGGLIIGSLIGGLLFHAGYRLPFYFAFGLGIILVSAVLSLHEIKPDRLSGEAGLVSRKATLENTTFLFIAWIGNFASWFIMGMMRNIFPVLGLSLGMSSRMIGFLFSLEGFSVISIFILLRQLGGWRYRLSPLLFCQVLASAGLIIGFQSDSIIMFGLSFVTLGICGGMSYFSSLFYSLDRHTPEAKRTGFHESVLGSGALLGPICGGTVARYYDLRAPYLSGLIVVLCAILMEIIVYRNFLRSKKQFFRIFA